MEKRKPDCYVNSSWQRSLPCAAAALLVTACFEPSDPAAVDFNVTATDTDGFESGTTGAGGSSGGPVQVQEDCIFEPVPGFVGLKYQCKGLVEVEFEVEILGTTEVLPQVVDFGHLPSLPEQDPYENPLVMACCPDFDAAPNASSWCAKPHQQACWVDFVQQACNSLSVRMYDFAEDQPAGIPRARARQVGDWLAANTQQCYDAFAGEIESTAPDCSSTRGYQDMLQDATWTFNPGVSGVGNATLSVISAEMTDIWPLGSFGDPMSPDLCEGNIENDGATFLEADPTPGEIHHLTSGEAVVAGLYSSSYVQATATFEDATGGCTDCSYVSHDAAAGWIDALVLRSNDPSSVTWDTSTAWLSPESISIALYKELPVTPIGWQHYSAAAGTAHFVISMTDGGLTTTLFAVNDNDLQIKRGGLSAPWVIKPFTLKYTDSLGQVWGIYVKEQVFTP